MRILLTRLAPVWAALAWLPYAQGQLRVPEDHPTLLEAVEASAGQGVILISPGEYSGEGFHNIAIDGALTIVGESPVVIDLGSKARAFLVQGTLAVSDVSFRNGATEDYGGAIRVDGGILTLNDCEFLQCSAQQGGGALAARGAGREETQGPPRPVSLNVLGCRFEANESRSGGACWIDGTPSQVQITGTHRPVLGSAQASFLDSHFIGNHAEGDGGALWTSATGARLNGCTFEQNSAASGGGLHAGSISLFTCRFAGNKADRHGGAAHALELDIQSSTLSNNVAQEGGAIYANRLRMLRTRIAGNLASGADLAQGGGVRLSGPSGIYDSQIVENRAIGLNARGGGLYSSSRGTYSRCLVANNSVIGEQEAEGGGAFFAGGATLNRCTVASNLAQQAVGAGSGAGVWAASRPLWFLFDYLEPEEVQGRVTVLVEKSILWGNCPDDLALDLVQTSIRIADNILDPFQVTSNEETEPPFIEFIDNISADPLLCGPLSVANDLLLGYPRCQDAGSSDVPDHYFNVQSTSLAIPENNVLQAWIGARREICVVAPAIASSPLQPWEVIPALDPPFSAQVYLPWGGEWTIELRSFATGERSIVHSGYAPRGQAASGACRTGVSTKPSSG